MHISSEKLKEVLVKSGVVTEQTFKQAKEEADRSGHPVIDILLGREDITEEYLTELLQSYYSVPLVDLKKVTIAREVLALVPEALAKSKNVIIYELDAKKKVAKAAMLDPIDYETIDFLRMRLGVWIEAYLTTPSSFKYALKQYKRRIGQEFDEVISESVRELMSTNSEENLSKLVEAVPIITILDSIIEHAVILNASDIHFEPLPKAVLVRYRVDGILHEILSLAKIVEPILVARVKVLANLQIDEHRAPQDGRFRFEMEEGNMIDVRVNIMPVMHGEKVEMRLLKSTTRPLSLDELGISGDAIKVVTEEIKKPHGMILVTGPTGHGKTTTLYAIMGLLNTPEVNITTIEDPIEYEMTRINQTQVNLKAGITFANGLRALLRQNPDIIMVGEIRDNDTVEISVHAALTGHLVLSSLHTNDAPSALPRLLDMGAPAFLLASTVNMVVAQRLVRRICTSCVISYPLPADQRTMIQAQIAAVGDTHIKDIPSVLYKGQGCKICGNSGFIGQIGIFEVLRVTDSIRTLLIRSVPVSEIRTKAIGEGMKTMFQDGLEKVEKGITTIEEILRVVRE
ncbi:MAG TPA: GspE/PulE family protein [Patescibacteria group bacterium]|jgi:type IV pilus assembly protein PilB|nr:GspE/PulE family protein [Patescibacteria group bacterium]